MMKTRLAAVLIMMLWDVAGYCQDLMYSQFYETPLLRNPALAGVFNGDVRVGGAYRNQWSSVTVPYKTAAIDAQFKMGAFQYDFVTLGVQFTSDVAGDVNLKRTQFLPVINFHKSLSEDKNNFLSLAFMGGPVQSTFDPSKAKTDDQFVNGSYSSSNMTAEMFNNIGYSYWDASTGISYSSSFGYKGRFYVGGALFHFNQPRVNFFTTNSDTYLYKKWSLNAGITNYLNDYNSIIAFVDHFEQGGSKQTLGGVLLERDLNVESDEDKTAISGGAFYRLNDALIPVVRLTMHNMLIGLSYDINLSKLKTASQVRGGFELTASYRGFWNSDNSSKNKTRCPAFP